MKQKNKWLKRLLYGHIGLFIIWVAAVVYMMSIERKEEHPAVVEREAGTEIETGNAVFISKEEDGPELAPSLPALETDGSLRRENIELAFPDIPPVQPEAGKQTTKGRQVVFIYHTHNRESFLPYLKEARQPEEAFHSRVNITFAGKELERALEQQGIGAISARTDLTGQLLEEGRDYGESYDAAREQLVNEMRAHRDVKLLLDIHRDSLRYRDTTLASSGVQYAQLLFVVGTGHAGHEQNQQFALQLHSAVNRYMPGLSKGILLKSPLEGNGVYNQDLSPQAVIVEAGGVDNTGEEIARSMHILAAAVRDVYWAGGE